MTDYNVIAQIAPFDAVEKPSSGSSTLIKAGAQVFHDPALALNAKAPAGADAQIETESPEYQSGLEAGRLEAETISQQAIALMERALAQLKAEYATLLEQVEASHRRVIRTCLMAVLPELSKSSAIESLAEIMADAGREGLVGNISISIKRGDTAMIEAVEALGNDYEVDFDDTLESGNVRLRWRQGGVDIDPNRVLKACFAVLADPDILLEQKGIPHG